LDSIAGRSLLGMCTHSLLNHLILDRNKETTVGAAKSQSEKKKGSYERASMQRGQMRTAFLLLLLASPALAQTKPSIAAPPSSCGPIHVQFNVKRDQAQPPAELEPVKTLIYVIGNLGDGTIRVGLDGTWIGANGGDSHFSFSVPPGEQRDGLRRIPCFVGFWREAISCRARKTGSNAFFNKLLIRT
jgi:hypothetical protein